MVSDKLMCWGKFHVSFFLFGTLLNRGQLVTRSKVLQ